MDYQVASFVRIVGVEEDIAELINDVKAETWTRRAEHAVLLLANNLRVLVRGGMDGIDFGLDVTGRPQIEVNGDWFIVKELLWHTHPRATGPSDFDRRLLDLLEQDCSTIHEINGVPGGTLFFRKANIMRIK